MTGLVVALPPVSNFPGGALTYAFHAAGILNSPIYAPGGIAKEFCPSQLGELEYYTETAIKNANFGFSLITTFGNDFLKYLPILPKPIIAIVHDGHTLFEFGGREWAKHVDGFVVDVEPTKAQILSLVKNASMIRIPIPYVKRFIPAELDTRENAIVSLGRLVPERGHRLVATLSSLGYKVYVVGQEVRHDEYGLYYKKLLSSGAEIISTPTDDERNKILSRVKIAMSFPFTFEVDEPVEYGNLECINMGVYPIVANWQKRYFEDVGFNYSSIECPADAVKHIDGIFNNDSAYHHFRDENYKILNGYSNIFKNKLLGFVESIKSRAKCSNCGEMIPVNCMYCGICGKR